ncbi:MAG: DUF1641 domain-containing protein [Halapricum sp.]
MSESQQERSPEDADFETLVAENPEAVARLLERLDEVNELLDVASLLTAAADDEMVQSMAEAGTNLGMAADGMATEELVQLGDAVGENAGDLAEGLEALARLQRTGTLDDLLALAEVASLLTAAMDDEMVVSLSNLGERLGGVADTAADEDVSRGLESVLYAVGDATSEGAEPVGLVGTARALRDPEVKAGMGVALALLKALGRDVADQP